MKMYALFFLPSLKVIDYFYGWLCDRDFSENCELRKGILTGRE